MANANISEDVLASLPPPPSALPEYPDPSVKTELETSSEDASSSSDRVSSASKLPVSAAKASSAARFMASKLAQSGRKVLSPLAHKSASSKTSAPPSLDETSSPKSVYSDPVPSTLTSSFTSSLSSASSSLGTLLFSSPLSRVNTVEIEDADQAAAAEVLRQVTTQQRLKILEDLVQYRRSDWNYLKKMHEGSNYWLNVALLREQQVMNHVGEKQIIRRGAQFYYLGIGLGRLVGEIVHPELLPMGCCQLLEELEFYFSSATVQGMKMMVATSSTLHEPLNKENLDYGESFRPTIYKWNQRPVYRRLMTSPIPFSLDYREVLLSLCDILALIYSKLIEDSSASENLHVFQSILRFDARIKKLFIDPVKKEFSAVASQVMAEEIRLVRKTYASEYGEDDSNSTLTSETIMENNSAM